MAVHGTMLIASYTDGSIESFNISGGNPVTTGDSKQPWDFDSFRVFAWSLRRHRYETGYIERNVKGYSPVLLKEVELTSKNGASTLPGFSICIEKKDGQRVRREYALLGVAIRFAGDHPCEAPPPPPTLQDPSPLP